MGINDFFKLERNVTFKLSSLVNDINILQKAILKDGTDVSPFISKLSHAFLPSVVYQLEEYGLPRMISKKIHHNSVINLLDNDLTIHNAIEKFHHFGKDKLLAMNFLETFDRYILEHFYDGITLGE
jgi:hypothetical protein